MHPVIEQVWGLNFIGVVLLSIIPFPINCSTQNHQTRVAIHLSLPEMLPIYMCCLSTNINNTLLSPSRMAANHLSLQLFTHFCDVLLLSRAAMCNHFSLTVLDHLLWRKSASTLLGHSSCLWGGPHGEALRPPPTTSSNLPCA